MNRLPPGCAFAQPVQSYPRRRCATDCFFVRFSWTEAAPSPSTSAPRGRERAQERGPGASHVSSRGGIRRGEQRRDVRGRCGRGARRRRRGGSARRRIRARRRPRRLGRRERRRRASRVGPAQVQRRHSWRARRRRDRGQRGCLSCGSQVPSQRSEDCVSKTLSRQISPGILPLNR